MKASVISAVGLAAAVSAQYNYTQASTTSTVYATSVYTITSCAPTVTDCPARIGQVTTDIISLYTTVCPVTETESKTSSAPVTTYTPWTTSTVYSTIEYTISKCPPEVTNCPVGSKTHSVSTYTTVCPVTTPYSVVPPPYSVSSKPYTVIPPPVSVSSAPYTVVPPPVSTSKPVLSTITISTCVPSYYTSVITVTPSAPAETYPATKYTPVASGYPVGPKNSTATYVPVTGGAASVKAGGLMAVVGLVAALL